MNSLLISDLHLTDNKRDEYRWALFDWLLQVIPELDVRTLFILGDLTDAKDYHSARLVNRIVNALLLLFRQTALHGTYILRGNHDGIDPGCPYFQFLGQFPSIKYIATPFAFVHSGQDMLMLPHTNNPVEDWQTVPWAGAQIVLMHATVRGALAENGQALDGIPPELLRKAGRAPIFSGDIHVPQKVGGVEYVGAPYPVRFGDAFEPRAILLTGKGSESIPVPSIRKHKIVLTATQHYFAEFFDAVQKGDQVKVVIRLAPAEFGDWQEMKTACQAVCRDIGAELCGLELEKVQEAPKLKRRGEPPTIASAGRSPEQVLAAYAAQQGLTGAVLQAGQAFLKAAIP